MDASLEPMRRAFLEVLLRLAMDPQRMLAAGAGLWERSARLGVPRGPSRPDADRRFRDPAWQEQPFFDFVRRAYLSGADWLHGLVAEAPGVDPHTAHQARFYARQLTEALAPSNFPALNPEVLRAARQSGGKSLLTGLEALLADLARGQGQLAPRMTDPRTFRLGENLATTPGDVIHEERLFQLLQYRPTTPTVHRRPLLVVPPWINKFYILDLRPENSFVRWAVERGHTVFLVSWVNPDESHADVELEDYLLHGLLPALDAVTRATGEQEVSALGYCIGGTLLAAGLAWLSARADTRVSSATLLTTQVDFSEPGDLGAFIDAPQLERLEAHMRQRGYLDGLELMTTFNLLRAKDLVWSFVVNNYLLGREPAPSDFLAWSSDPTRLPARAHATYLRELYLHNRLIQPGAVSFGGVPLDLGRVRIPLYVQACREDHIAPFRSVYRGARHYAGPVRFVLAGSGHVAGVINPPAAGRYRHWVPGPGPLAPDADAWLAGALERPGSWWADWEAWQSERSTDRVPARIPGEGALPCLEPAPGRYVRPRLLPE
ncbi:PHA/PHB synthase family protein [Corallococcus carmarthensis]|uniref:Class I poly(R)-hydroxyalkanoic acid synthase n=1 Tax=Corallococcus carmarthensis TaxID=2316728 RepID=A0A3A8KJ06_9BACT|nr:class I poly(R)-hydroxyalkanoic acid synthase [Corallococcus carmarthensis]RKH07089.1 class I poly(R)-hydroxyalkanoic acid synthase [Corallococcus carmarthensis]